MDSFTFTVTEEWSGSRLDSWLAHVLEKEASRARIQNWIKEGCVEGPYNHIKNSLVVKSGDQFQITPISKKPVDLSPVKMDLEVLYEDPYIAIIHKPPGIAVHPGPGDGRTTLMNGIVHRWKDLPPAPDPLRPGIVHRLDKPTEGILILAKSENAHRRFSDLFRLRLIEKEYLAWLLAPPPDSSGEVNQPIKRHPMERTKMMVNPTGRPSRTGYVVEKSCISRKGRKFTFVRLNLYTGRTHQIRVHMSYLGAPVVGDPLYSRSSKEFNRFGLLLLAHRIKFHHPFLDREMEFQLELPQRFLDFEQHCGNL